MERIGVGNIGVLLLPHSDRLSRLWHRSLSYSPAKSSGCGFQVFLHVAQILLLQYALDPCMPCGHRVSNLAYFSNAAILKTDNVPVRRGKPEHN